MISLSTLLHRTPVKIHRNSNSCSARITSSTMNADEHGAYYFVRGSAIDRFTTRKSYKSVVKVYVDRDGKIPTNPKIFIWCACAWFKFHCEVALAIRGSSYIANSNGALPKITNPTARPQCCKHCLAMLRVVRSQPMKIKTKAKKAKPSTVRADAELSDSLEQRRPRDPRAARAAVERPRQGEVETRTL